MAVPHPRPPNPLDKLCQGLGVLRGFRGLPKPLADNRVHVLTIEVDEVGGVSMIICASGSVTYPSGPLEKL